MYSCAKIKKNNSGAKRLMRAATSPAALQGTFYRGCFNGDKTADGMRFTSYLHLGPNLKTLADNRTVPLSVCVVLH